MKQTYKVNASHEANPKQHPPLNTWEEIEAESPIEAADTHGQKQTGFPFIMVAWHSGAGFEILFSIIHNQPVYTVESFENGHHNK